MRVGTASDERRSVQPVSVTASGDVRRFRWAAIVAIGATSVPYAWVLFDLWNSSPSLLRTAKRNGFGSNFYDLQARAMLGGHLSVPRNSLGIEAYIHDGRTYTYFGPFPSLIRMPILLVTHGLDGHLTAVSMLLAWLAAGVFSSLLIWRVRVLIRGSAPLDMTEAVALGMLVATITGGSVLVFLAASPYVFSEDLAWSVAVTIGSLFALLGVLERPSWARVLGSGGLVLAANLTRPPTGYASVFAALLVSAWFALGRGGPEKRRWWGPVLAAGLLPLAVGCAVNVGKFGVPFGLPLTEGLAFKVLGGPNSGHEFSVRFLPSTLYAYLRPDGLRLTPVFPFITLPAQVTEGVGGVQVYGNRTSSLTASMPLLFLLSVWGSIAAFRRQPVGPVRSLRLLLAAAAAGAVATLIFGWIYNRYLADFLPFLVLAASVGAVDLWRRLESRPRRARTITTSAFVILGLFGIVANVAMAVTPSDTWAADQALRYVQFQRDVSGVTGHPLAHNVELGYGLPGWAPADHLFVDGYCHRVYISDGEGSPNHIGLGLVWLPVGQGPDGALCRSLIDLGRLRPPARASLARADEAFAQLQTAYGRWAFESAKLSPDERVALARRTAPSLSAALERFDVAVQGVPATGLPDRGGQRILGQTLVDARSLQSALSAAGDQSPRDVARWQSAVNAAMARVTASYSGLLHLLVGPPTA